MVNNDERCSESLREEMCLYLAPDGVSNDAEGKGIGKGMVICRPALLTASTVHVLLSANLFFMERNGIGR